MITQQQVSSLITLSERLLQAGAREAWDEMAEYDQQRRDILSEMQGATAATGDDAPRQADIDELLRLDRNIIQLLQTHSEAARQAYLETRQKNSAIDQYNSI